MKATVRRLHSPDVDLQSFVPVDAGDVGLLVQVLVGPADGPGEESFDVLVCTPRYLANLVRTTGPMTGRHLLIVDRFELETVREHLAQAIESQRADNWQDLATLIGRIGKWEFEDYPGLWSTR